LHPISYADARALANKGAAFLDVRAPHEFRRYNIPGSINIPLPLLRANLARLHSGVEYITYCNSGNFSAAAAFLLAQGGLKVRLLAGGLKAHEGLLGQAAPTSRENETPAAQVADTRATPTSALGQTEPVAAVERNDTRLWTPIPAARDLPPEKLRILEPLNVAAPTRNRDVRCIERPEDIAWAQQSLPRSAREQASSTPLSSTHGTAAPQKQDVELGWISDTHLWETVLGYRRDPSVDKLLDSTSSGDAAPRPAQQSGPIGGGRPTRNYVGAQSAAIRGSSATRTAASKTVRAAGERPSVTNYTVVQATNRPLRVVLASLAMFAAMGVSLTLMPTSVIEKLGPGATLTSQRLNQTTQRQANAQTSASAPLPRNNATAHGRERLPADGTPSNGTAPSAPTQAPPEVAIF
jgi:rhodanese-related sulfurtransferase